MAAFIYLFGHNIVENVMAGCKMACDKANKDNWKEHYEKSKSHVEEGNYLNAIGELELAEEGLDLIYSDIGKSIATVVKVWEALGDVYFQLAFIDESAFVDQHHYYGLAIRYYEQIEIFILQRRLQARTRLLQARTSRYEELWDKMGCPFDIKQLWRKLGRAHDNKARLCARFPHVDEVSSFFYFGEAVEHLEKALDYYERSDDGSLSQIRENAWKLLQECKKEEAKAIEDLRGSKRGRELGVYPEIEENRKVFIRYDKGKLDIDFGYKLHVREWEPTDFDDDFTEDEILFRFLDDALVGITLPNIQRLDDEETEQENKK